MRRSLRAGAVVLVGVLALVLAACSPAPADHDDGHRAAVGRPGRPGLSRVLRRFSRRNPDVTVALDVVPYADYFATLPDTLAAGTADDVSWLNSSYFGELADRGALMKIDRRGRRRSDHVCLGSRGPAKDTLLPAARRLTAYISGRTADIPGFDPVAVTHHGFNAGRSLQAVYHDFVGSNGGRFQNPDGTFAFAEPRSVEAFQYPSNMINRDRVAPPAAETDDNPDFSRDRFIAGRLGPFRSGTYNLKNVADGAGFEWGIAPMVAGPAGRVSVVNSVIAAGNARTAHPEAVARVLGWLGSTDGAAPIGTSGAASPAVTDAQQGFFDHWQGRGVDTRWFGEAGGTATVEARRARGSAPGGKAFQPVLSEVFAGRTPVGPGLQAAQDAADAAIR